MIKNTLKIGHAFSLFLLLATPALCSATKQTQESPEAASGGVFTAGSGQEVISNPEFQQPPLLFAPQPPFVVFMPQQGLQKPNGSLSRDENCIIAVCLIGALAFPVVTFTVLGIIINIMDKKLNKEPRIIHRAKGE